ncbi:methyltransferase domain-containing protein [Bacillus sp. 165]|uniref:class I SAM-dependent methyltransferase n=1 Tax=Bacillus sp. 165 TaxID=1529117 RepID=UPI001ADD0E86|nr:methyltransferase domain-containing protein [Bacillus sp. 165]MBO9129657.1 methyltransferase domain-containing protein [Bacillus sp. 165]
MLDQLLFLRKFITSPRATGSVAPSSSYLARTMLKDIDWENCGTLVELGAGTGVFTTIINDKIKGEALIFENDQEMYEKLKKQYPRLLYFHDARNLASALEGRKADYIISGLPFANFSEELQNQLLDEIQSCLKQGGVFVTYQYSLQLRKKLEKRFKHVIISFQPINFPPAFVYHCQ